MFPPSQPPRRSPARGSDVSNMAQFEYIFKYIIIGQRHSKLLARDRCARPAGGVAGCIICRVERWHVAGLIF